MLSDLHKGEWRRFFSFTEEEQLDIDFSHASFFCEAHKDSPFNKDLMIAMKTKEGRITLDGKVFKQWRGDKIESVVNCETDAEVDKILEEKFGLKR